MQREGTVPIMVVACVGSMTLRGTFSFLVIGSITQRNRSPSGPKIPGRGCWPFACPGTGG